MDIVAFSQDASHLVLGAFATFCAILLWSRTRDMAWTFVIIGAIVSYADIVLHHAPRASGSSEEDLFRLQGRPGALPRPGESAPPLLGNRVSHRGITTEAALTMAPIHIIPARDEANIEQKLVTLLLAAVQEKPDLIISVFAGTPAFGAYQLLVERAHSEFVDFSQVRFVVFDELVRPEAPFRFRAVLDERLFVPLGIPHENVVSFNPARDRDAEAARIKSLLAVSGHRYRAALGGFPRAHRVSRHGVLARLHGKRGPRGEQRSAGARRRRSPSVLPTSRAPRRILLFAAGRNLAEIVQRLTEGSFDPTIPISVLQRHGSVTLIADTGASSRITREDGIRGFYSGFYILDSPLRSDRPTGARGLPAP